MKQLSLSRSSKLYGFVFGRDKGWFVDGLPEPRSARISLGLFGLLLIFMAFIRTFAAVMILMLLVLFRLIGFLIDGSYARGSYLQGRMKIIKIEPWPTLSGRRLSPYFLLIGAGTWLMYQYFGLKDAGEFFLGGLSLAVMFYFIDPKEKSASEQFAETAGPAMEKKLALAYYREPVFFPALRLVD